jgi:nucleoside-diphosphate-sugar epimerase
VHRARIGGMKRALITGGLGFIGYHLSVRLLAKGFAVDACDNGQRGRVDAQIEALMRTDGYRLIRGDLADTAFLETLGSEYSHIFHLAATVGVKNVTAAPDRVLTDNILSLINALRFARAQPGLARFVFASTSEVYAGTLQHFGLPFPTPESTPLALGDLGEPRTTYMLSKIYGEALCHHLGVPFTIVRPHNIYGPRMGMAHVIPELLERARLSPPEGRLLVHSAHHKRSFCYIDDAIEMMLGLAMSPAGSKQTFNIGSADDAITIARLAELVVETVGTPVKIEPGADTPGSPVNRHPDVRFAIAVSGHQPRVSLPEGIRRTYEWYRARAYQPREIA